MMDGKTGDGDRPLSLARWTTVCLLAGALALPGCGGGGGGGGGTNDTTTNDTTNDTTTDSDSSINVSLSANVSDAETVYAHQQAVTEADSSTAQAVADDGRMLFSYRPYEQGVTEAQAKSMSAGQVARSMADDTSGSASNLISVDSSGNSSFALESELPIKANYTVTGPQGNYLYVALSTDWEDPDGDGDGTDYGKVVAETGCAFYKVKLADDSLTCVKEGLKVQTMDSQYRQQISNNRKPIQFDDQGNAYFLATEFTVENDWVSSSWEPRLYKEDGEGSVTALTQDNEQVEFFLALSNGEAVYKTYNYDANEASLKVYQDGSTYVLTTNDWLEFFAADTYNTVMWGGNWDQPGIQLARPVDGGGFKRTALETPFGSGSPTPKRVIIGDDGYLYGVFSEYFDVDEDDDSEDVLSVYRILPFSSVPRAQMVLGDGESWWDLMEGTTFQVSKGYLYYVEQKDISFDGVSYGKADVINVVNLETREEQEVLAPDTSDDSRYTVYNWQLSDGTLHFSALDQTSTQVVQGEIDSQAVKAGKTESEFLTTSDVASASDSSNRIQDIEAVGPKVPEQDTSSGPTIQAKHPESGEVTENLQSLSLEFSKFMDRASVEGALALTADSDGSSVPSVPVWIYKNLHLVPDTSGVGDDTYTGLARESSYTVNPNQNGTPMDKWDWELCGDGVCDTYSFTTLPIVGWYISTGGDGIIASGDVAKYATDGSTTNDYKVSPSFSTGPDVRIEFSAKGYSWYGMTVKVWDEVRDDADFRLYVDSWPNLDYDSSEYSYDLYGDRYVDDETGLMSSLWTRYRINAYGSTLEVKYATDCTGSNYDQDCTWQTVDWGDEGAVADYQPQGSDGNKRHIRIVTEDGEVAIDNLKVEELNSDGTLAGNTILSSDDMTDLDLGADGGSDGSLDTAL